jgi:hypothetical protein
MVLKFSNKWPLSPRIPINIVAARTRRVFRRLCEVRPAMGLAFMAAAGMKDTLLPPSKFYKYYDTAYLKIIIH